MLLVGLAVVVGLNLLPSAQAVAPKLPAQLGSVPSGPTVLASVDVATLTASPTYPWVVSTFGLDPILGELKSRAGFDVRRHLKSVVVAMPSLSGKEFLIVGEGTFVPDRWLDFARKTGAQPSWQEHAGTRYLAIDKEALAFRETTGLFGPTGMVVAALDTAAGKQPSVLRDDALIAMAKVVSHATVWAVLLVPPDRRAKWGAEVAVVGGGITLDKRRNEVLVVAQTGSKAEALRAKNSALQMLAALAEEPEAVAIGIAPILKKIAIEQTGSQVRLRLSLTAGETECVQKALKGVF